VAEAQFNRYAEARARGDQLWYEGAWSQGFSDHKVFIVSAAVFGAAAGYFMRKPAGAVICSLSVAASLGSWLIGAVKANGCLMEEADREASDALRDVAAWVLAQDHYVEVPQEHGRLRETVEEARNLVADRLNKEMEVARWFICPPQNRDLRWEPVENCRYFALHYQATHPDFDPESYRERIFKREIFQTCKKLGGALWELEDGEFSAAIEQSWAESNHWLGGSSLQEINVAFYRQCMLESEVRDAALDLGSDVLRELTPDERAQAVLNYFKEKNHWLQEIDIARIQALVRKG